MKERNVNTAKELKNITQTDTGGNKPDGFSRLFCKGMPLLSVLPELLKDQTTGIIFYTEEAEKIEEKKAQ